MKENLEKLEKKVNELELHIQKLESRFEELKSGNYGTGIYLDGCSEADIEYITGKPLDKKAGE